MATINMTKSSARLNALRKCASHTFVKVSADRSALRRLALTKSAGLASDYLATVPASVAANIPYVGLPLSLAGAVGNIRGLTTETQGDKNPETSASNLVPGVGAYRLSQRIRRVADQSNRAGARGTKHLMAELVGGGLTAPVVGGVAGGLTGVGLAAALGGDKGIGAVAGGVAGATLPSIVAALVAAIRRRRTAKEQIEADSRGVVPKYLVPGLGVYDYYKRIGASVHNDVHD